MVNVSWFEISPVWHLLGWTLLHSLWQLALVAILVNLILRILPAKWSGLRYTILLFSLVASLSISIITFGRYWSNQRVHQTYLIKMNDGIGSETIFGPFATESNFSWSELWYQFCLKMEALLPFITIFWMLGLLCCFVYFLFGLWQLYFLSQKGISPPSTTWQRQFDGLCQKMGISESVDLFISNQVKGPITYRMFKPVILVPVSLFTGLTVPQIEAVLLHELAHIRRYDFIVNIFQGMIEILFFYHPAIWWISGKIREEREHCCDDLVLSLQNDPFTYADALTQLQINHFLLKKNLAMSAKHNHSVFSKRIFRLFGKYDQKQSLYKSLMLIGVLVLICSSHTIIASKVINTEAHQSNFTPQLELTKDTIPDPTNIIIEEIELEGANPLLEFPDFDQDDQLLVIIDGQVKGNFKISELDFLDPEEIEQINVSKREVAAEKNMGEATQSGVLEIFTKKYILERTDKQEKPAEKIELRGVTDPLVILDGVKQGRSSKEVLAKIPSDEIDYINVIKGKEALIIYGEEAEFGVVEIYTNAYIEEALDTLIKNTPIKVYDKKGPPQIIDTEKIENITPGEVVYPIIPKTEELLIIKTKTEDDITEQEDNVKIRSKVIPNEEKQPLFILDGEVLKQPSSLKEIVSPDTIERINVLKGEAALEKYGIDAQFGAVEIYTKKKEKVKKEGKKGKSKSTRKSKKDLLLLKESNRDAIGTLDIDKIIDFRAFPNPSKGLINIQFQLADPSKINLSIYSVDGKLIKGIASGLFTSGLKDFTWQPTDDQIGTYLIQLEIEDQKLSKPVIVY